MHSINRIYGVFFHKYIFLVLYSFAMRYSLKMKNNLFIYYSFLFDRMNLEIGFSFNSSDLIIDNLRSLQCHHKNKITFIVMNCKMFDIELLSKNCILRVKYKMSNTCHVQGLHQRVWLLYKSVGPIGLLVVHHVCFIFLTDRTAIRHFRLTFAALDNCHNLHFLQNESMSLLTYYIAS